MKKKKKEKKKKVNLPLLLTPGLKTERSRESKEKPGTSWHIQGKEFKQITNKEKSNFLFLYISKPKPDS